ncbi:hypothetical protein PSPO01_10948 [Paraphaeosphaeria sporulosa]
MMLDAGKGRVFSDDLRCTFRHWQGEEAGHWLANSSNRLITCWQDGGVNHHFIGRGTTLTLHVNVSQHERRNCCAVISQLLSTG